MGYDMYHENKPAAEVAAYDQKQAAFQEAVRARDALEDGPEREEAQKRVQEAYDAMSEAEPFYFRLNIFGMHRYMGGMDELGMLDWEAREPDFGTLPERQGEEDEAYEEAVEALVTRTAERPRGLPGYKFGTNDGWLVAPAEIEAALKDYKRPDADFFARHEIEEDYWDEWIQFLRRAVERGGFRVY